MMGKLRPEASGQAPGDENSLSLRDLLNIVRKRIWVVLLVATVLTGAALAYSLAKPPMYEASIKILVGQDQQASMSGNLGGDVQGLQQLTQTMAEGINSTPVAEAVIKRNGLQVTQEDFLKKYLNVKQIAPTQYIQVTYQDTDPERAQRVANSVGEVFKEQVDKVSPSANGVTAIVWSWAELPDKPIGPKVLRNTLVGLAGGLMLGLMLACMLEYLDDRWRSPEEAEEITGVPTFGVIPEFSRLKIEKAKP